MARASLIPGLRMRKQRPHDCRCSYVVLLEETMPSAGPRELAGYLSELDLAGCDVVVLDPSPQAQFEVNARTFRWVGRHVPLLPEHRAAGGVDIVRAASSYAACEKVLVAAQDVRYTAEAIVQMVELLDVHEVVEPQDYLDPMPWWGGIEAGRMLIHRAIEPQPDHGATFGFRRSALRALRALGPATSADAQARRLAAVGAEVHPAGDVFVRREPVTLRDWVSSRPRLAGADFALPVKTAFFFSLVPVLLLLGFAGGMQLAAGYAGIIAFASVGLAARGRAGTAASFFPLRACLLAPLWVLERSVSVYWALLRKLTAEEAPSPDAVPDRASNRRAAM